MPRVEELRPVGRAKDRYELRLDDGSECHLSAAEVERFGLSAGDRLSAEEARALLAEGLAREALDRALRYLSHRPRSRFELERYLRRRGYEDPVVGRVIDRCEELGHVDDLAYAEAHVRDRIRLKPRGAARLRAELRKRGVDREVADRAISAAFEEEDVSEAELLEREARKRWRARRSDDPRTLRRRMYGHLQRRGFPGGEIGRVVDELLLELEAEG